MEAADNITSFEAQETGFCLRHLGEEENYPGDVTPRESLRAAIFDLLWSRHPGRVRLAANREDLPLWLHYLIMWVPLLGCVHARVGLAANLRLRSGHGYRLVRSGKTSYMFPLARNYRSLPLDVQTKLLFNNYSLGILARLRGLTDREYYKISLMGAESGTDAFLAGNPDVPETMLSAEVRNPVSYWNRKALLKNPGLPFEEVVWARRNWPAGHQPVVDSVLDQDRWDEFQEWLSETGNEALMDVPAEWVFSVLD